MNSETARIDRPIPVQRVQQHGPVLGRQREHASEHGLRDRAPSFGSIAISAASGLGSKRRTSGRPTGWSRTVDFRITVILMTSNIGSAYLPVDVPLSGGGAIAVRYESRAV